MDMQLILNFSAPISQSPWIYLVLVVIVVVLPDYLFDISQTHLIFVLPHN